MGRLGTVEAHSLLFYERLLLWLVDTIILYFEGAVYQQGGCWIDGTQNSHIKFDASGDKIWSFVNTVAVKIIANACVTMTANWSRR